MRDLRLRAREIGDQDWLFREEQKRTEWRWENALRRHNFIGFVGEVMKGVVGAKLNEGEESYNKWIQDAEERTKAQIEERKKKGGAEEA